MADASRSRSNGSASYMYYIALCWQSACNNLFEQNGDLLSGLVRLTGTRGASRPEARRNVSLATGLVTSRPS